MIEWLRAVVALVIFCFWVYSLINWLMLPTYVDKIANELRGIKEELKERK